MPAREACSAPSAWATQDVSPSGPSFPAGEWHVSAASGASIFWMAVLSWPVICPCHMHVFRLDRRPGGPAPQLAPRPPPSAGFLSRPERGEEPPPRRLRLVLPSSQACPKLRGQATPGPTRDLTPLSGQRLVCLSSYKYFHQTSQAPPCVKPRLGQRTRGLKPLDTGGHSPCHGPRGQRLKADRPLTAGARAGCVAPAQGPGRHGD